MEVIASAHEKVSGEKNEPSSNKTINKTSLRKQQIRFQYAKFSRSILQAMSHGRNLLPPKSADALKRRTPLRMLMLSMRKKQKD